MKREVEYFGLRRIACAVPPVRVADVKYNCEQILKLYHHAENETADIILFPELSITSSSCGDLFSSRELLDAAEQYAALLAREVNETILVCGLPLRKEGRVYNCACVMQNGRILGAIPKSSIPSTEKRQFTSGSQFGHDEIAVNGENIPFGLELLFVVDNDFIFGTVVGDDLLAPAPVDGELAIAGATLICHIAARPSLPGKAARHKKTLQSQSSRCICSYASVSAGQGESSTDTVCGGHAFVCATGDALAEKAEFSEEPGIIFADVDFESLSGKRMRHETFCDMTSALECWRIEADDTHYDNDMRYFYNPAVPFLPDDPAEYPQYLSEMFAVQCAGLAARFRHSRAEKLVLGISGGLDSTQTLLCSVQCCRQLNRPVTDVVAVTMPGFGTSDRTYRNAVELCRLLGVTMLEISIKEACLRHFSDIDHDPAACDVTFENAQARERTQILMDLANKIHGLVIGTGDLSEVALGWCTYNGDHMSMYGVNGSIPKTLLRYLIAFLATQSFKDAGDILTDIVDTPVSPELLPPNESGEIKQKTETLLGPYELHDYFIYHLVTEGCSARKLEIMAAHAFGGRFTAQELHGYLKLFFHRFFQQQFKRNCMPDGPQCTEISLSPRGGWHMPSDVCGALWQDQM